MRTHAYSRSLALSSAIALTLSLAACGSNGKTTSSSATATAAASAAATQAASEAPTEVKDLDPRAAIAYDGGILVIDTASGKTVADIKKEGFLRLNPAGDNRHAIVTSSAGFEVLDLGLILQPHGDHFHYYTSTPKLTGSVVAADKAGHVVTNAGRTALFADGTGTVTSFDLKALEDGQLSKEELTEFKTATPHHGVAVPLSNGNTLVTEGTAEERHTVHERKPDGSFAAETTDCPGVHGEATAKGEDVASFGCTNGSVVFSGGQFHKVSVPEEYQRSGNQFGHHDSPYVLTDYKTVKPVEGADPEHPTKVGIINTTDATTTTVELGSAYWFRSFGRGAAGEGVVLTNDGKLNIIDMASATVTKQVDVVTPWTENAKWQEPGPNVKTVGDFAYVTDPATKKLHIVQISEGRLLTSLDLGVVPNEMVVIDAEVSQAAGHEHKHEGEADHKHEGEAGHDHDHKG
ncbi:Uncharacterised protein [Actinomyces bovis]|uniref:Secreted protein n=1 Tax=Actinomyces bovis TaxID=1658 RepID=A0ABY1VN81_9ACTO|nr:hypothetical protein [Actinomyces bovis]SPT53553.1 Uncharacterised protein [Actinomyces bovis]VEG55527.1 Uncharacterised protein [Actinomyces israelii]